MESPINSIMAALSPMMPKKQPVKNPVSEFLDNLLTEKYGDAAGTELLHLVVVNSANEDPNGVLQTLADLHDRIGVFITEMTNGGFKSWTVPEAAPADNITIEIATDRPKAAVLELP